MVKIRTEAESRVDRNSSIALTLAKVLSHCYSIVIVLLTWVDEDLKALGLY